MENSYSQVARLSYGRKEVPLNIPINIFTGLLNLG
jgi:hypothetical protein